jgi:group I intron endonuclease
MATNCGVYKIENVLNGKYYIGQSIDLRGRKKDHYCKLRHNSGHNSHLQNAFNKYGEYNFEFSILVYCEIYELTRYEGSLDSYYKRLGISYNTRICIDSSKGIPCSETTKAKISKSNAGKHPTEKTRLRMSIASAGKNNSNYGYGKHRFDKDENTRVGHPQSEATKDKISKRLKGICRSEETKKRMSEVYALCHQKLKETQEELC